MSNTEILARAYMKAMAIEFEVAMRMANEVKGEKDVMKAALKWAKTNVFAQTPVIEGYSPKILAEQMTPTMRPTGIFSSLARLKRNPQATLVYLNRTWRRKWN